MSIEVDWERLTGGPDGEALAESIRAFIHDRFQQIQLPRFIRSVQAHSFHFGNVTPHVEVKDVCDPLPDFYDSEDEDESPDEARHGITERDTDAATNRVSLDESQSSAQKLPEGARHKVIRPPMPHLNTVMGGRGVNMADLVGAPGSAAIPRAATAGIPGGTSNMSYFHLPLTAGLSGASTPLATSASRFGGSLIGHLHQNSSSTNLRGVMPPPPVQPVHEQFTDAPLEDSPAPEDTSNDLQIVTHLRYDGNVKLSLTAEVALDYPMDSFVGIPLQLNVTGLTFDGVAILAYIKHKAHFCFLAPEDADALVGGGDGDGFDGGQNGSESAEVGVQQDEEHVTTSIRKPVGGLFEEIRVESEIGEREKGRQVLKNIGKVEKFVLDQVRRIFETELVYPSFWTFLV